MRAASSSESEAYGHVDIARPEVAVKSARHKIAQRCEGKQNPQQRRSAGNDGKRDRMTRARVMRRLHTRLNVFSRMKSSGNAADSLAGSLAAARRKAYRERWLPFLHFSVFDRKNTNFFWNAYRRILH